MGAKKKAAKKKKPKKGGNGDSSEGMGIALYEDKIKYLQSQTESLEMQLAYRTEVTANASAECKSMREKMIEATQQYKDERQTALDISKDMTRQYKGMQEDLLNKINDREGVIQNLKDELETTRKSFCRELGNKDAIIEDKDNEIVLLQKKMEDLSADFGMMLSEALNKMKERIEVHSAGFDVDQTVPIQRRMEEFKLDSEKTMTLS